MQIWALRAKIKVNPGHILLAGRMLCMSPYFGQFWPHMRLTIYLWGVCFISIKCDQNLISLLMSLDHNSWHNNYDSIILSSIWKLFTFFLRNNSNQILLGLVGEQAASGHVSRQRRMRQNGFDQWEVVPAWRELHGDQRAVQLLLHVGDVAEDTGKAAREESRKKLRSARKQEACLLLRFVN